MVFINVTNLLKILIKTVQLRELTSFYTLIFQKQRAVNSEGMVRYRPLSYLNKTLWY